MKKVIELLQKRWNLKSVKDVFLVLLVFVLTGTTIMLIKKPILAYFSQEPAIIFSVLYYIVILPLYNLLLLVYGFMIGKFSFFWEFEKRFFRKMLPKKK